MSYANGTTNYNLPQTVGTDKRDWFDTNKPFEDVDADLHEAVTKARESATDISTLGGRVSDVETAQSTQAQDIIDIKATQETQGTAITALGNKIDDVEDDCLDMICAVDEGTAQVATVAVTTGHYFRYNNVLYMATADIAIGDTIVPNTNCRATNVATELEAGGSTSEIDDSTTGLTTTWSSSKISNEIAVKTGDTRYNNGNLEYYDGTQWTTIQIGGDGMKCVFFKTDALDTSGAGTTIDISSLGFTDANDYTVILNVLGGAPGSQSTSVHGGCYIAEKTATSFKIVGAVGSSMARYSVQVLA